MINKSVGNAEKSVGFFTYKAIKIISAESAIEMARKKSNNALGNGTIIIAKIAIIKKTTVKSFELVKKPKKGAILPKREAFFSVAAKSTPKH